MHLLFSKNLLFQLSCTDNHSQVRAAPPSNGARPISPGVGSDIDFTDEEEEEAKPTVKDLIGSTRHL